MVSEHSEEGLEAVSVRRWYKSGSRRMGLLTSRRDELGPKQLCASR